MGDDLPHVECATCDSDVAVHPVQCLDCLDVDYEDREEIWVPKEDLRELVEEWRGNENDPGYIAAANELEELIE